MLLIPLIGISALAAYLLRSTWLFIPALVNVVLNFCSLGVLNNYRGPGVSGHWERVVDAISMLTSAIGVILLLTSFFIR